MRTLLLICCCLGLVRVGLGQRANPLVLAFKTGVQQEKIDRPGQPFSLRQYCTPAIDSVVNTGTIIFKKSSIGLVEECVYSYVVQDSTLRSVSISTKKRNYTLQVVAQANAQYGQPQVTGGSRARKYVWRHADSLGRMVVATLNTNKQLKKAKFTVSALP